MPKEEVTYEDKVLGTGHFGTVVRGSYKNTPVAIKTISSTENKKKINLMIFMEIKVNFCLRDTSTAEIIGLVKNNNNEDDKYKYLNYDQVFELAD